MSGKERVIRNYNPPSAVDLVIEVYDKDVFKGIVLIERGNPPFKGRKALPGGFQEMSESLEETAVREGKEETGLDIVLLHQLMVYSRPGRDPRGPVNSVGYVCRAEGMPVGGDDAASAKVCSWDEIPQKLAFDHAIRIKEYFRWAENSRHENIFEQR
ncbi:NUDIX hydrolase [Candidatus Woesearchaeota archaeon]|nr:NUDIX hydrolase [Candidatus Woesearchaeota archaeon]